MISKKKLIDLLLVVGAMLPILFGVSDARLEGGLWTAALILWSFLPYFMFGMLNNRVKDLELVWVLLVMTIILVGGSAFLWIHLNFTSREPQDRATLLVVLPLLQFGLLVLTGVFLKAASFWVLFKSKKKAE